MADSHVIPKAFMWRTTDAPFVDWGGEGRPRRLYSGWYDRNILTDAGEKYFNAVDDAAAKCFVENGFTYRKRRNPLDMNKLGERFVPNQFYQIEGVNSSLIRLFGLSLLWRAAVSKEEAFKDVKVSPSHLADLRDRILCGDAGPCTEYALFYAVFCDATELTKMSPFKPKGFPFYRFFLDGVVCYVSPIRYTKEAGQYGNWLAGAEPGSINLFCFPSLDSNQERYTSRAARELYGKHGNVFSGLEKAISRRR